MNKKQKIYVIVGPTATGKSDYAVKLAKKVNGEVISADSRQVYKGLDIATGKITKKEMKGVPHHMLNVADPRRAYSAACYIKNALRLLRYIVIQGKTPIICGGTGFYISALLGEIELANVPANKALRKKLSKKSTYELFTILKKLNPKRAKNIDNKNPVRLIRAIEIASNTNNSKQLTINPLKNEFKIIKIGLDFPDAELKKRIHIRLLKRIKQGMIAEAKKLHKNGLSFKRMNELGLEYRFLAKYSQGEIDKKELLEKIEKGNWDYAKRQRTWFRRDKNIKWV
ncbi:MAG: tRNA (adenosine(37)-N6)-dimethylallyltransferase MiaA [Patescibacteria group bacterium]